MISLNRLIFDNSIVWDAGVPDGITQSGNSPWEWRQASTDCSPSSRSWRPGAKEVPIYPWTTGRLRSASMINVDLPRSRASTYPRLTATADLPSPFTALVTTMTVLPRFPCINVSLVAATRNCSVTTDQGRHLLTRLSATGNSSVDACTAFHLIHGRI